MADKFTYQPLQNGEIRLLTLLPGQFDDAIRCTLTHASLSARPAYSAVSYTWGAPDLTHAIEVDGVKVPVRENLFNLLRHYRPSDLALVLWTDALCINQESIPEKNVQVPLMGHIYSYAQSVLVWLGLHADESEHVFDYFEPGSKQQPVANPMSPDALDKAFKQLCARPYWTRTWIVQEIVLASALVIRCGDKTCSWRRFTADTLGSEYDRSAPDHVVRNIVLFRNGGRELSLRRLLFRFHITYCFDKRDLVYSLMNIAKDTRGGPAAHGITIDYAAPIEVLFLETLAFCSGTKSVTVAGSAGRRAIECLRFCDTLATRLGVELKTDVDFNNYALMASQSSPVFDKRAKSRSYFVRLWRFARIVSVLGGADTQTPTDVDTTLNLAKYSARGIPGKEALTLWSANGNLTSSELVFAVDFDGPSESIYQLCCICSRQIIEVDEDGEPSYRYHVVDLGVAVADTPTGDISKRNNDIVTKVSEYCAFLNSGLQSLKGREVLDGLPDYVIELALLELVTLCQFARAADIYQPWSLETASTVEHWKQDQGAFGN